MYLLTTTTTLVDCTLITIFKCLRTATLQCLVKHLLNVSGFKVREMYRLTYNLSSRQIFGPTTLAAPLAILKAKCPGGHDLDKPHLLYLVCFVAANIKLILFRVNTSSDHINNNNKTHKRGFPLLYRYIV